MWRVVGFRQRPTAILAAIDAKLRQTANAGNGPPKMHGPGAAGWRGVLRRLDNFPDLNLTSRCHLSLPTKQGRGSRQWQRCCRDFARNHESNESDRDHPNLKL